MNSYPVFLKIKYVKCLIIGGGLVATRKVKGLLAAGALPVVIAPGVTQELNTIITENHLSWFSREYQPGDTAGFQLIIAATNSVAINQSIREEAFSAGLLVNDVTDPEGSNFHVPAMVRRYPLELAIGTSGEVPYLTHKIRDFFEHHLSSRIGEEIAEIQQRRATIIKKVANVESSEKEMLKAELLRNELDPLIEKFLAHFIKQ
jgi:precorrin-2 dehydrogenase / sirohydrochlorin ferrochelatase